VRLSQAADETDEIVHIYLEILIEKVNLFEHFFFEKIIKI
jgi:hypothetical protein